MDKKTLMEFGLRALREKTDYSGRTPGSRVYDALTKAGDYAGKAGDYVGHEIAGALSIPVKGFVQPGAHPRMRRTKVDRTMSILPKDRTRTFFSNVDK